MSLSILAIVKERKEGRGEGGRKEGRKRVRKELRKKDYIILSINFLQNSTHTHKKTI